MPLILFGGQFSNSGTIQAWISWVQYISPVRYCFEALVANEFDERSYNSTMIMKSLTRNYTVSVLNAFTTSTSFDENEWVVQKYPDNSLGPKGGLNSALIGSYPGRCSLILQICFIKDNTSKEILFSTLHKRFILYSQWNPEQNPKEQLGFDIGIWKCCVILIALAVACKILAFIFLRLLVKKFQ